MRSRSRWRLAWGFVPMTERLPTIVRLLEWRRPSTVAGFVSQFIVDAVERHSGWPLTHVFQKGFKAVKPIGANSDAPFSVIFKAIVLCDSASPLHCLPAFVSWRWGSVGNMSVCCWEPLFRMAATSLFSVLETFLASDSGISTIAKTNPVRVAPCSDVGKFYNRKVSKSLTDYINSAWTAHCYSLHLNGAIL